MSKLRPVGGVANDFGNDTQIQGNVCNRVADVKRVITQDRQAIHTLLREGVESKRKDTSPKERGGDVDRVSAVGCTTCGQQELCDCETYNQALDDILTLVDELFSDKTDTK